MSNSCLEPTYLTSASERRPASTCRAIDEHGLVSEQLNYSFERRRLPLAYWTCMPHRSWLFGVSRSQLGLSWRTVKTSATHLSHHEKGPTSLSTLPRHIFTKILPSPPFRSCGAQLAGLKDPLRLTGQPRVISRTDISAKTPLSHRRPPKAVMFHMDLLTPIGEQEIRSRLAESSPADRLMLCWDSLGFSQTTRQAR